MGWEKFSTRCLLIVLTVFTYILKSFKIYVCRKRVRILKFAIKIRGSKISTPNYFSLLGILNGIRLSGGYESLEIDDIVVRSSIVLLIS